MNALGREDLLALSTVVTIFISGPLEVSECGLEGGRRRQDDLNGFVVIEHCPCTIEISILRLIGKPPFRGREDRPAVRARRFALPPGAPFDRLNS